ncbi:MAG TPA: DUF5050 domain-containing protein [Ignavibacteria bacterium]
MQIKLLFYFSLALIFLSLGCDDDTVTPPPPPPPPPSGWSTIDYEPAWSPDGHTIAYFHNQLDTSQSLTGLYLIDSNGSNKRQLLSGLLGSPDFSPDGNWITFDNGQIFKIKINGDSLIELTSDGGNYYPAWSPDGKWIAYDHPIVGSYTIWKIKFDGSNLIGITYDSRMPSWSPDGKNIVHVRYFSNNNPWEISIIDSAGQNPARITFNNNWEWYPRYSPDGQKIIFTLQHETSINFQIYTINTDGTGLTKLTDTQGYSADYSPDGEKIVYCDSSPGNGFLWIMNKSGSNKKQLTFP